MYIPQIKADVLYTDLFDLISFQAKTLEIVQIFTEYFVGLFICLLVGTIEVPDYSEFMN